MKIIVGQWFRLPRLGRETFALMMRQGVKYDQTNGFKIDYSTDVEAAARTIRSALAEDVELSLACSICGKEACPGCPYLPICDRKRVSSLCLCDEHSSAEDNYSLYTEAFSRNFRR
jgi:hypothetical protein